MRWPCKLAIITVWFYWSSKTNVNMFQNTTHALLAHQSATTWQKTSSFATIIANPWREETIPALLAGIFSHGSLTLLWSWQHKLRKMIDLLAKTAKNFWFWIIGLTRETINNIEPWQNIRASKISKLFNYINVGNLFTATFWKRNCASCQLKLLSVFSLQIITMTQSQPVRFLNLQ